jgi:HK97 family phage prohead protease
MQNIDFSFECKSLNDSGVFEGYASVFNEKDLGSDIVVKGAFAQSIKTRGAKGIKMFGDHDPRNRVGVWTSIEEDEKGLLVKGRLLMAKSIAKDIYIDLKEGALDGLSIGGMTKKDKYDGRRKARMIEEFDLFEISLVSIPMNQSSRVVSVKSSMTDMSTEDWREIEATLRTKGLSRSDAVRAVSGFKEWSRREGATNTANLLRDEDGTEIAALIRRNIETINLKG